MNGIQLKAVIITWGNVPSLQTFLLHGQSFSSFFPDVTQKSHLFGAVFRRQTRGVAAFQVNTPTLAVWLPRSPGHLLGLKRLQVGTPVHVSRRAATVSAVQPKIVQDTLWRICKNYVIFPTDLMQGGIQIKTVQQYKINFPILGLQSKFGGANKLCSLLMKTPRKFKIILSTITFHCFGYIFKILQCFHQQWTQFVRSSPNLHSP